MDEILLLSPCLYNASNKYFFIKLISYLPPLNDNTGISSYHFSRDSPNCLGSFKLLLPLFKSNSSDLSFLTLTSDAIVLSCFSSSICFSILVIILVYLIAYPPHNDNNLQ